MANLKENTVIRNLILSPIDVKLKKQGLEKLYGIQEMANGFKGEVREQYLRGVNYDDKAETLKEMFFWDAVFWANLDEALHSVKPISLEAQKENLELISFGEQEWLFPINELDFKSKAVIWSGESDQIGNDVFWFYTVCGLHLGDPIEIAVKNARYEADGDESGTWYELTSDGFYYGESVKTNNPVEVPDTISEEYNDALMGVVREDYNSL